MTRPFGALLAAVRRLPLWAQVVILALVIAAATTAAVYFLASHYTVCPPEYPDCGPWEKLVHDCTKSMVR